MESIKKKNSLMTKELVLFDKKADEATAELIAAQEELEIVREQKTNMQADIESMKAELLSYLKQIKSNKDANFLQSTSTNLGYEYEANLAELKHSIQEQRNLMDSLNKEIVKKKKEIDSLRERSLNYVAHFKEEIDTHENILNEIKAEKESLSNENMSIKSQIMELNSEIKCKNLIIAEKNAEIKLIEDSVGRVEAVKVEETKKLEKIHKQSAEKRVQLDTTEVDLEKLVQNFETLKINETELLKSVDKLNVDVRREKDVFDKLRHANEELNAEKMSLEHRLEGLNESIMKITDEYEKRESQLNKLNMTNKEKQLVIKRQEEELAELEYEKENLSQEIINLTEKYKMKSIELEKCDETAKLFDTKLNEAQHELNGMGKKLNDRKNDYDAYLNALKELESKFKELSVQCQSKQQMIEQLNEKFSERKDELDNLEAFLDELKTESKEERKLLNNIQVNTIY